jgi:lipase chaperone LimK
VAFWLWRLSGDPDAPAGPEHADGGASAAGAASDEPLPPSLEGSVVGGGLRVDQRGQFVPGPDALNLFDHYLGVRGEASEDWIQAQVRREIDARLPPSAQGSAHELFAQYVSYLEAAAALGMEGLDPEDMQRRLERLQELRREAFGPVTARQLFEEQESVERVAIERRRVMDDPNLDARERIRRLAELQSRLPESVQRAEAEAYAPLRLARDEERLRAEGATEAEIQALRQEQARAQEGQQEEALDRTRQAWSERMKAYRAERDRVLLNVRSAPDEAKAVFLRRVRERHFEPEEIPRVEALDRIELRDRSLGNAPIPGN